MVETADPLASNPKKFPLRKSSEMLYFINFALEKLAPRVARELVATIFLLELFLLLQARMYDTYTSLCPVKSFEFYLSKLHPMQPRLFQQPRKKTSENSVTWYGKSPIGEKALQQMMANISSAFCLFVVCR